MQVAGCRMTDVPLGLSARPPWRIRADNLRQQLQQIPRCEEAIGSLSKWLALLRGSPYETQNTDERLSAAFTSKTDSPVAWCAGMSAYLLPELEASLRGCIGGDEPLAALAPLTRYVLGRACLKSVMAMASGSVGLSLAYDLLWPVAHDGIADAGADDELLDQFEAAREARVEIEAEARRRGANPISAARRFDHDRTAQAIGQASSPVSLEACTHWQIQGIHADSEYERVIQVIGSVNTAFAAELLETIGNAALVASVIRGPDILDIPAKGKSTAIRWSAFDLNDRWTGRTMAWMILLDIKEKLPAPLQEQSGVVRSVAARPSDPQAIIRQEVAVAAEALLSRPDGARLALEWLAHLLWSVLRLRIQSPGPAATISLHSSPGRCCSRRWDPLWPGGLGKPA
jgi:hypothetical protein